jgi:hypothetical protein
VAVGVEVVVPLHGGEHDERLEGSLDSISPRVGKHGASHAEQHAPAALGRRVGLVDLRHREGLAVLHLGGPALHVRGGELGPIVSVPFVDSSTLTSVREQGRVVSDKGLSSVEDVGVLCAPEEIDGVEAREAVDKVDRVREAVRALGERPCQVRVDALADVLELRRSRLRRWMPLAALDGEAGDACVGVEALERVDAAVRESAVNASYAEVAEARVPEIGGGGLGGNKVESGWVSLSVAR